LNNEKRNNGNEKRNNGLNKKREVIKNKKYGDYHINCEVDKSFNLHKSTSC